MFCLINSQWLFIYLLLELIADIIVLLLCYFDQNRNVYGFFSVWIWLINLVWLIIIMDKRSPFYCAHPYIYTYKLIVILIQIKTKAHTTKTIAGVCYMCYSININNSYNTNSISNRCRSQAFSERRTVDEHRSRI